MPAARHALLAVILLGYAYLGIGYARATPRWNNPDEPAHFTYVRHVAQTGYLPVLELGDWDAELLADLTTRRFPTDDIAAIRYEGHQPPLYYLLGAAIHRLTWGLPLERQVLALKGLSIVLGAVTVFAAYVVGREAAPDRPELALLASALAAFVPMHGAISAAVNNDSLANALAATILAALMIGRRRGFGVPGAIGLGALLGLALLTKLTLYVYVPLALVVLYWSEFRTSEQRAGSPSHHDSAAAERLGNNPVILSAAKDLPEQPDIDGRSFAALRMTIQGLRRGDASTSVADTKDTEVTDANDTDTKSARSLSLGRVAMVGGVALLVAAPWLLRNVAVYGLGDPLGLVRHDAVVVGQPRWETFIPPADLWPLDYFFRILFRGFWGVFGWMGVILDDGFYVLYFVLTLLGLAGLALPARDGRTSAARSVPSGDVHTSVTALGPTTASSGAPIHANGETVDAPSSTLRGSGLLAAAILLVFGQVAYYNLTFVQPQGRYLFPALVPVAVFLAAGWWRLAQTAGSGRRIGTLPAALLAAALAWSLAEWHGATRARELWSDDALIVTATLAGLAVLASPRRWRAALPLVLVGLCALALALLDYAALVRFVAPAFPPR